MGRRRTDPRPLAVRTGKPLSVSRLGGASVVSVRDVSRAELLDLFFVAACLETKLLPADTALAGKVLLTAFFESSTRTRLSFESAAHRLGGAVISVAGADSTVVHKGESLADIGTMITSYADMVVLRHSAECSVDEIRAGLDVPLINGGNGRGEHPTQAMADWYALLKWRNELGAKAPPPEARISLCVLGVPRLMRSMRSFLLMAATCFPRAIRDLAVVSNEVDPLGPELEAMVAASGWSYWRTPNFTEYAQGFDVIYQNALVPNEGRYDVAGPKIRLDQETPLKPEAVILHPLARHDELSTGLDDTPHNLYFDQAAGAVFVRQALLLAVAGRIEGMARIRYGS